MKALLLLGFLISTTASAVFTQECDGRLKMLAQDLDQQKLSSQLAQDEYEEVITICKEVYYNLNDEKRFEKKLKKAEKFCEKAYGSFKYTGAKVELLSCQVNQLQK